MLRSTRSHRRANADARSVAAALEPLEGRMLLTVYSYTVPLGHSVAYLQQVSEPGQIRVRLDDPVTGLIGHTFTNTTGQSRVLVQAGVTGFTFVDQTPGAWKPGLDDPLNGHQGLKVEGGIGNTLRVEAQAEDHFIGVSAE